MAREAQLIESEDDDGWSFLIGYVARIDEEACWIRHFDLLQTRLFKQPIKPPMLSHLL